MDPVEFAVRRRAGLRGAIVIGLALALVGAAVGTATGAVTPFQLVIVKNTAAEPVPVTGTISVGNTPANQNVTVTNPDADPVPVSGTVDIGSIPDIKTTTKSFTLELEPDALETALYPFGQTINLTMLVINNADDDSLRVALQGAPGGGGVVLRDGDDGSFTEHFTMPIPATGVFVTCLNLTLDCLVKVTAVGY